MIRRTFVALALAGVLAVGCGRDTPAAKDGQAEPAKTQEEAGRPEPLEAPQIDTNE